MVSKKTKKTLLKKAPHLPRLKEMLSLPEGRPQQAQRFGVQHEALARVPWVIKINENAELFHGCPTKTIEKPWDLSMDLGLKPLKRLYCIHFCAGMGGKLLIFLCSKDLNTAARTCSLVF